MSPSATPFPVRHRWTHTLWLGVTLGAAVLMVVLALADENGVLPRHARAREIAAMRTTVALLAEEQKELEERLDDLAGGHFEMERIARERLGLARENELIYRFDEP